MRINRFRDFSEVTDYHLGIWETLAANQPMMSPQWIIPWWQSYQDVVDGELCLLAGLSDDDRLIGIAPFYVANQNGRTKKLRLLGDGHICSDHMTLLSQSGRGGQFVSRVSEWLLCEVGNTWDTAELECIDAHDVEMLNLIDRIGKEELSIYRRPATSSWKVELPKTWEEYLSRLSKNHRKRCRRWYRNWIDSGKLQHTSITRVDEFDGAFQDLCRLHNARRNFLGSPGAFESEAFLSFHEKSGRELMSQDRLRINLLVSDDKPMAAEYQLTSADTVYSYQSGVDPEFLEIGAGNISLMMAMKSAIDDGYCTFDFLRGSEVYKKSWAADEIKTLDIHVLQKTLNGSLTHASLGTKDWLRSIRSVMMGS